MKHQIRLLRNLEDKEFDAKYITYKNGIELSDGRGRFEGKSLTVKDDQVIREEEDGKVTVVDLDTAS